MNGINPECHRQETANFVAKESLKPVKSKLNNYRSFSFMLRLGRQISQTFQSNPRVTGEGLNEIHQGDLAHAGRGRPFDAITGKNLIWRVLVKLYS